MNKVHNHDYDPSCKERFLRSKPGQRVGECLLKEDAINPDHYSGDLVMRVIEERSLDFALGNAVKYLCRAGSKPGSSRKQDLLKAQWYLNRAIEKEESSTD